MQYCKLNTNIIKIGEETNCETDLIKHKIDNCDSEYFKLSYDYYVALNNGYQWFVAPAHNSSFQILCTRDKYMSSFVITQNSLLTIREDCFAKSSKTSFVPGNRLNFTTIEIPRIANASTPTITYDVLPFLNLHLINTKPLHKGGIKLEEINNQLELVRRDQKYLQLFETGESIITRLVTCV